MKYAYVKVIGWEGFGCAGAYTVEPYGYDGEPLKKRTLAFIHCRSKGLQTKYKPNMKKVHAFLQTDEGQVWLDENTRDL